MMGLREAAHMPAPGEHRIDDVVRLQLMRVGAGQKLYEPLFRGDDITPKLDEAVGVQAEHRWG